MKDPNSTITQIDVDAESTSHKANRDEPWEGAVELEAPVCVLGAIPEQIVAMQQADPTLKQIRDLLSGMVMEDRRNSSHFHY